MNQNPPHPPHPAARRRTGLTRLPLLALLAAPALAARAQLPPAACAAPETARARLLMGTILEIRIRAAAGGADSAAAVEAAFTEVAALEAAVSGWDAGSELEKLHAIGGGPHQVSERLAAVLDAAVNARDLSGGAFDPAVGTLVAAYDLHGAGRWPDRKARRAAVARTGAAAFNWNPKKRELMLAPGTRLDFDGIAKGVALDRAGTLLRAAGVIDALFNFGGQILLIGPPAHCPARMLTIAEPDGPARPAATIAMRDGSLSTSSNHERSLVVDGRPFGHLLDPRRGGFASFEGSVTVAAPSGALADALSTALFVRGPRHPVSAAQSKGIRAAFLQRTPGGFRLSADAAFQPVLQTDP